MISDFLSTVFFFLCAYYVTRCSELFYVVILLHYIAISLNIILYLKILPLCILLMYVHNIGLLSAMENLILVRFDHKAGENLEVSLGN